MQIRSTNKYNSEKVYDYSFSAAIEGALSKSNWDRSGELESMRGEMQALAALTGRLLEALVATRALGEPEIRTIIGEDYDEILSFVREEGE